MCILLNTYTCHNSNYCRRFDIHRLCNSSTPFWFQLTGEKSPLTFSSKNSWLVRKVWRITTQYLYFHPRKNNGFMIIFTLFTIMIKPLMSRVLKSISCEGPPDYFLVIPLLVSLSLTFLYQYSEVQCIWSGKTCDWVMNWSFSIISMADFVYELRMTKASTSVTRLTVRMEISLWGKILSSHFSRLFYDDVSIVFDQDWQQLLMLHHR